MNPYPAELDHLARVSEICAFAYPDEFAAIPERDREFYFARGTENHRLWQLVEEGAADQYDFDPEVEKYRPAHARFLLETGFRALPGGIEKRVVNEELGYKGTMDRIGTVGNRIWLPDYKTSAVKDKIVRLQTALYLLGTNYKFSEVERYGVAFRNDGKYSMSVRYPESDKDEAVYWAKKYQEANK